MNINDVVQIVGTLGFPIVACGALFWKMNKDEERRSEESSKLQEAISNNTLALTELSALIRGGGRFDES